MNKGKENIVCRNAPRCVYCLGSVERSLAVIPSEISVAWLYLVFHLYRQNNKKKKKVSWCCLCIQGNAAQVERGYHC